jgi:hypothetical protein
MTAPIGRVVVGAGYWVPNLVRDAMAGLDAGKHVLVEKPQNSHVEARR